MTGKLCRGCGREFADGEQFCPTDGSRLSSPSQFGDLTAADPLIGSTLDARYRILRVIGEGGMGVVYEAQHVMIEKHVAIKVLRETFTSRPDVVERFRQEAKSASKIGHPNIVDVSDFGETPSGQSYIVMEMLTGEDLADVLGRERALPPGRAVRIMYQVARALHATHRKNIVHRDLKPENVYLIERDGSADVVKIVDFGVAKMNDVETAAGRRLTRTGMIFGTPEYMSPEQALGRPFDHRVDIYALGAIFFELLTGRVPFEGENFMEILAKHAHARLPTLREANPGTRVSAELEGVVMRALHKEPAQRYQSMGELAAELRNVPEMPSVVPGDAFEPPTWELLSTPSTPPAASAPSKPPPLPRSSQVSGNDSLSEVVSLVMQNDGTALASQLNPLPLAAAGGPSIPLLASAAPVGAFGPASVPKPDAARSEAERWPPRGAGRGSRRNLQDAELVVPRRGPARAQRLVVLAAVAAALGLLAGRVVRNANAPTLSSLGGAEASAQANPTREGPHRGAAPVDTPDTALTAANWGPGALQPNGLAAPAVLGEIDAPAPARVLSVQIDGQAAQPTTAEPEAPTPHGSIAPAGPDMKSPNLVEVQVRTEPAGAKVRAVGTGAHCQAAPCALSLPRGRPVTLRAETGRNSVERTMTFEDESEVELRLSAVSRPPKPLPRSDLKIPAIFRDGN